MVSATGCCQRQKQEAGRSLPRPVALRGQTSPASTPCLKWKCCSNSWPTVSSMVPHRYVKFCLFWMLWGFTTWSLYTICANVLVRAVSGDATEVWIGLWKPASLLTVEWSDGSPVTLTLWHQYEPPHSMTDDALCAKVDRKVRRISLEASC